MTLSTNHSRPLGGRGGSFSPAEAVRHPPSLLAYKRQPRLGVCSYLPRRTQRGSLTNIMFTAGYQCFVSGDHEVLKSLGIGGQSILTSLASAPRVTRRDLRVPHNPLKPRAPPAGLPSLGGYRVLGFLLMVQDRLLHPACTLTTTLHRSTHRRHPTILSRCANPGPT